MSAQQMSKLEQSLVELGAEVFKLRHEMAEMQDFHACVIETLNSLRMLLQDKGAITVADLDAAAAAVGLLNQSHEPLEQQLEVTDQELVTRKRLSH